MAKNWVEDPKTHELRRAQKPGRKKQSSLPDWLQAVEQDGDDRPDEIILNEDAPYPMFLIASFTNFLNRNEMDDNVRNILRKWRINEDLVLSDRELYSSQLQSIRDSIYSEYSDRLNDMGNYIIGDTTSGMGSVMAAMTGERDKRGRLRS